MAFAYTIRNQEGQFFVTFTTRSDYVDSIRFYQRNKGLRIYAWVIMTNHIEGV